MATQTQHSTDTAQIPKPADISPSELTPDKFTIRRPARARLSSEETRRRMEAFAAEREEAFVAAVREDEN